MPAPHKAFAAAEPATVRPSTPTPPPAQVQAQAIEAAAAQIEHYLRSNGRSLEFRVDSSTGRTVVSVRNPQTGEIIRQIPGEETLRMARALDSTSFALIDIRA